MYHETARTPPILGLVLRKPYLNPIQLLFSTAEVAIARPWKERLFYILKLIAGCPRACGYILASRYIE